MFLEGRTPEQIREAESRTQQQADLRLRQQNAVLHHDFDKMRREVETLGEQLLQHLTALYLCVQGAIYPVEN